MKKHKILCLAQLPPPVHGASMMNKYIKDSEKISTAFDVSFLPLSFTEKIDDIGKLSFKKIFKMIAFCLKLIKAIIQTKPDLVYFTIAPFGGAFYRDALFVFIIKLFRKKIVFHLHGKGIAEESKNAFKKKIYQFTFKNSNVITLSKMLDYDVEEVFHGRIYHLANGIETNKTTQHNEWTESIKVLYLSNLVKSKGILDFIEALELIKNLNVAYEVDIVGNSADLSIEELKTLINKKGLSSKIKVHGPKYGHDKWEALQRSDIFVFPTKNDCFPLVLLEAMQSRNAIISTNNGAIEEIIRNCGLIVPQNSPKELAVALKALITNPERVQILKEKSRKEFETKYTLDIFENNLVQILKAVLNENL